MPMRLLPGKLARQKMRLSASMLLVLSAVLQKQLMQQQ